MCKLEDLGFLNSLTKLILNFQELQWSESKGAVADDGYTTELVAVKGKANVSGRIEEFSFMVKLTPEIGPRAKMVKEVRPNWSI